MTCTHYTFEPIIIFFIRAKLVSNCSVWTYRRTKNETTMWIPLWDQICQSLPYFLMNEPPRNVGGGNGNGISLIAHINTLYSGSSAGSIAESIFEYRTIQGRTFHSDKHNSLYFTPNDEQQLQSVDITYVLRRPVSPYYRGLVDPSESTLR